MNLTIQQHTDAASPHVLSRIEVALLIGIAMGLGGLLMCLLTNLALV